MPSMKGFRRKISRVYKANRRKITESSSRDLEHFFPLMDLCDDLILHILSFVSYAPFEPSEEDLYMDYVSTTTGMYRMPTIFLPFQPSSHYQAALNRGNNQPSLTPSSFGTLTHVFPLVCHRFADLCLLSDGLWKESMFRLSVVSPSIWEDGLTEVTRGADVPSTKQAWNLHLYEPRYRLMVSEIMRGRSIKDKSGHSIPSPGRPRFLLSSGISFPLTDQDPVFIAEVVRCDLKRDGRAFITVQPTRVTRIQSVHVRPNSSGLIEATVRREITVKEKRRLPVFSMNTPMRIPSLYSSMELFIVEENFLRLKDHLLGTSSNSNDIRPRLLVAQADSLVAGKPALLVEIRRSSARPEGGGHVLDLIAIAKGRLQDPIERFEDVQLCDAFIDVET